MIGTSYGDKEKVIGLNEGPQSIYKAQKFSSQGLISDTNNIKDDPVWIMSATRDQINPKSN